MKPFSSISLSSIPLDHVKGHEKEYDEILQMGGIQEEIGMINI
jgi:hypothetical protein